MASRALMDGKVKGGHKIKVVKGQIVADDWYWQHFPDLFERADHLERAPREEIVEGGDVND